MKEPLQVDTDVLDAANAILKSAAGQIPTQLPQFSVNGSDSLSAAIGAGSAQMEAPMAALPGIQAKAKTVAGNIGVAGQKYRETDETLAQKAKQQQFAEPDSAPTTVQLVDHKTAPPPQPTPTPTPPIPPEIQKRLDEQDAKIAEQGKQIADQAASDGASIDGAAEAAATGCASAVVAVTVGQVVMDPTKPPEEMNGALLAGTCVAGAGTGVAVYGIGKMVKGIVKDIEDAIK